MRPVNLPYIHKVTHRLKRVAQRHGVPVVFSARSKLGHLCAKVERGRQEKLGCGKKHKKALVPCAVSVVYKIELSCGRVYLGQSGRCIKDRLREHAFSIRSSPSGNLAIHCDRCGCSTLLYKTIVARHSQQVTREMFEA